MKKNLRLVADVITANIELPMTPLPYFCTEENYWPNIEASIMPARSAWLS